MAAPPALNPAYHANTAAELIHYRSYVKTGTSDTCWTRWASADENFNVVDAGGLQYLIRFDSNFSKKHLATFSKKEWKTEAENWLQSQNPAQAGQNAENWNRAQKQLLDNKILKTLGIRSGTSDEVKCANANCRHPRKNVPPGTGHSNAGNCQVVVGGAPCPCVGYVSSYVQGRGDEGKPLANPYQGASASQSSCIVLNWIPKNEFQLAVGNSIVAAEAAYALLHPAAAGAAAAVIPQSPANGALEHLTWTFPGRPGAVRHAMNGVIDLENGTYCNVGARKINGGPVGITSTWVIVHWEGQG